MKVFNSGRPYEHCRDCLKKVGPSCSALTVFQSPCFCRSTNVDAMLKENADMMEYAKSHGVMGGASIQRLIKDRKRLQLIKDEELREVYNEEIRRGSRGGSSDSDANNRTSLKQKMKDNRAQECKPSLYDVAAYKEAVAKWEMENGSLEKLRPNDGIVRSSIDSYTGDELPVAKKRGRRPKQNVKENE